MADSSIEGAPNQQKTPSIVEQNTAPTEAEILILDINNFGPGTGKGWKYLTRKTTDEANAEAATDEWIHVSKLDKPGLERLLVNFHEVHPDKPIPRQIAKIKERIAAKEFRASHSEKQGSQLQENEHKDGSQKGFEVLEVDDTVDDAPERSAGPARIGSWVRARTSATASPPYQSEYADGGCNVTTTRHMNNAIEKTMVDVDGHGIVSPEFQPRNHISSSRQQHRQPPIHLQVRHESRAAGDIKMDVHTGMNQDQDQDQDFHARIRQAWPQTRDFSITTNSIPSPTEKSHGNTHMPMPGAFSNFQDDDAEDNRFPCNLTTQHAQHQDEENYADGPGPESWSPPLASDRVHAQAWYGSKRSSLLTPSSPKPSLSLSSSSTLWSGKMLSSSPLSSVQNSNMALNCNGTPSVSSDTQKPSIPEPAPLQQRVLYQNVDAVKFDPPSDYFLPTSTQSSDLDASPVLTGRRPEHGQQQQEQSTVRATNTTYSPSPLSTNPYASASTGFESSPPLSLPSVQDAAQVYARAQQNQAASPSPRPRQAVFGRLNLPPRPSSYFPKRSNGSGDA